MSDVKIRNMEEFAAVSGISRPTVSKYFNNPDSVRATTRRKIEIALEIYDYRPNIYAINQNRKLTKNIGIVVPYLTDPFFGEIARNIEQHCRDAGYRPTLFSSHGEKSFENDILDSLRSLKPAGVLLAPLGRVSDRRIVEAFCRDVPTVLFDSNIPDLGTAFVGSDNPQFTRLIVDYLCRTGEPPCFFEMQNPSNPNANKRRESYICTMEAFGHEPKVVSIKGDGWDIEKIGYEGGLKALDAKSFQSDTVLCSNDRLAIGFLTACYEKKLRIGGNKGCDIRVAGQDDHPFSRFTCPPLTTVAQPYEAVSQFAVETLFKAMEHEEVVDEITLFEGKLVMRQSA
ncbi:LacI family transcriptional regulator [Rhodobacteraceae bacterium]|nr:LacI family transcriptional regulator [Paracoccaceae bacterium]